MHPLVEFYLGGRDAHGRTLDEILKWSDEQLEKDHTWVQWVFPLDEPSRFNLEAPILDDEIALAEFRTNEDIRERVGQAVQRFMQFLEFRLNPENVQRGGNAWDINQSAHWLTPMNHNYLRITRLLRFLKIVGMGLWSDVFLEALLIPMIFNASTIGNVTLRYWAEASGEDWILDYVNESADSTQYFGRAETGK